MTIAFIDSSPDNQRTRRKLVGGQLRLKHNTLIKGNQLRQHHGHRTNRKLAVKQAYTSHSTSIVRDRFRCHKHRSRKPAVGQLRPTPRLLVPLSEHFQSAASHFDTSLFSEPSHPEDRPVGAFGDSIFAQYVHSDLMEIIIIDSPSSSAGAAPERPPQCVQILLGPHPIVLTSSTRPQAPNTDHEESASTAPQVVHQTQAGNGSTPLGCVPRISLSYNRKLTNTSDRPIIRVQLLKSSHLGRCSPGEHTCGTVRKAICHSPVPRVRGVLSLKTSNRPLGMSLFT